MPRAKTLLLCVGKAGVEFVPEDDRRGLGVRLEERTHIKPKPQASMGWRSNKPR